MPIWVPRLIPSMVEEDTSLTWYLPDSDSRRAEVTLVTGRKVPLIV